MSSVQPFPPFQGMKRLVLCEILKDVFSYRNLIHAFAGATGGFTAMTVFYPLDKIRTILQVDDSYQARNVSSVLRRILEKDGIQGLYRGWLSVITSLWCSNFVYFYSYTLLKRVLYGRDRPTPAKDLTAAAVAGIINVLVTTPMWVVNTRLKLQRSVSYKEEEHNYKGMIDCFQRIIKAEGVRALWNGTGPSLMLVCNPTIQFVVYESLKRRCCQLFGSRELSSLVHFTIGAISKAVATLVTYPVQMIQSRLRAHAKSVSGKEPTVSECFYHILNTNGWKGFYKGIDAKLLQTILTAALMFMTYEKIASIVFRIMS